MTQLSCARFPLSRPLDGLDGAVGDLPWLGLPLAERQDRAFVENGLELVAFEALGGGSRLVVREDVALTPGAVKAMLEAISADGTEDFAWRAEGRVGNLAHELAFGREEPLLVFLAPGGAATVERIAAAPLRDQPAEERLIEFPLAEGQFSADVLELPLTERLVLPAGHWVQLLWANLLGMGPWLYRTLGGNNVVTLAWRLFWAVVRARSLQPQAVAAQYRRIGKGCRIHPSAVVEASWIGDGVEIGPNAVVRGSILADGAKVEPLALVEGCVMGRGATVQRLALAKFSVLCDRSMVGGDVQLAVLGAGAAVKRGAQLFDQAFDQAPRVRVGESLHGAPLGLIGVGVGARSLVGAGVRVAPGRAVPSDLQLVVDTNHVVRRLPREADGLHEVKDGGIRRLGAPVGGHDAELG